MKLKIPLFVFGLPLLCCLISFVPLFRVLGIFFSLWFLLLEGLRYYGQSCQKISGHLIRQESLRRAVLSFCRDCELAMTWCQMSRFPPHPIARKYIGDRNRNVHLANVNVKCETCMLLVMGHHLQELWGGQSPAGDMGGKCHLIRQEEKTLGG